MVKFASAFLDDTAHFIFTFNAFVVQELDLRLNPVTKNEPDYRLFIVHTLPNLRRLG